MARRVDMGLFDMTKTFGALALAFGLALGATPTLAQDPSQDTNFGEIRLRAGFTPDPFRIEILAGGDIDADTVSQACVGQISDAPDFRLTYEAGSLPLVFRTLSGEDTTLVINGPNGDWRCDDDGFGDGDAEVRFDRPLSGVYDIWIGTYQGGTAEAELLITETP